MSILKTVAIIGGGYLLGKYAMSVLKQPSNSPTLPANTCNCSNANNTGDGSNQQTSNTVFPSLINSIAELINDVTSTPQQNIYY